jgi:hypothetical protein
MASDNFNRSNANPLDNSWTTWSGFSALRLVSNEVATASGSTGSSGAYQSSTELSSQVTIKARDSGTGPTTNGGPAICINSGNGYFANQEFDGFTCIYRIDSNGFNRLVDQSYTNWAVNDVVRLRRSGNSLIVSVNGADTASTTDTTYMTGNSGMFIYNGDVRLDDWTDGAAGGATIYNRSVFGSPIFGSRVIRG